MNVKDALCLLTFFMLSIYSYNVRGLAKGFKIHVYYSDAHENTLSLQQEIILLFNLLFAPD